MAAEAEQLRTALPPRSRQRAFLLGVEAAALEIIQPNLAVSHAAGWLDRQPHALRQGYLRTSALLAAAAGDDPAPQRLPLPSAAS
jgi:hypothetical protein